MMDAMFKFHKCGFETCAIVCDGASSNLTMIKEMTGADRKAYGYVIKVTPISVRSLYNAHQWHEYLIIVTIIIFRNFNLL